MAAVLFTDLFDGTAGGLSGHTPDLGDAYEAIQGDLDELELTGTGELQRVLPRVGTTVKIAARPAQELAAGYVNYKFKLVSVASGEDAEFTLIVTEPVGSAAPMFVGLTHTIENGTQFGELFVEDFSLGSVHYDTPAALTSLTINVEHRIRIEWDGPDWRFLLDGVEISSYTYSRDIGEFEVTLADRLHEDVVAYQHTSLAISEPYPIVTPTTWNPFDKGAAATLSDGDLSITSKNDASVRSILGVSSGKWYWEITAPSTFQIIHGIGTASAKITGAPAWPGADLNGWGLSHQTGTIFRNAGSSAYYGFTISAGQKVGVCLDMDAGTLRYIIGGVLRGVAASGLTGIYFAMAGGANFSTALKVTANFGATPFTHDVPDGFNPGLGVVVIPDPPVYAVEADEFIVSYGNQLECELATPYLINGDIAMEFAASYSVGPPYTVVGAEFGVSYLAQIESELGVSYSLQTSVEVELIAVYSMTQDVATEFSVRYAIKDTTTVQREFAMPYAYMGSTVLTENDNTFIQANGSTFDVSDLEISCDEGSATWELTCTLRDVGDILNFKVNDPITVVLEGETFNFVVDSRSIDRQSPSDPKGNLFGRSPIVKYQSPRAKSVSKTWTTAMAASAIALEMIPDLTWDIIDWEIPAGVFGVQESTPYDVVARVAEAAGGLVESMPDGSIVVRYKFPVSVPHYRAAIASHTLSDTEDNFSSIERYSPSQLVDILTIGDREVGADSDRVEFVQNEDYEDRGLLRVYPPVWRDNISARATGYALSVSDAGVSEREVKDEQLEFINGRASTRYPVVSITALEWRDTNLGGVTFKDYSSALLASVTDGYSMAKITYRTKAHEFSLFGQLNKDPIQVVIED